MTTKTPPYSTKIPLTAQALKDYRSEFSRLTHQRSEVMERLKTAREMGDLSENGAYQYAKFELGHIGRRLRYLRQILRTSYIAPISTQTNVVEFGRTVTLKNATQTLRFQLVSEYESDISKQKLSLQSPIGQAIKDKKTGDTCVVETPQGQVTYTIIKIE